MEVRPSDRRSRHGRLRQCMGDEGQRILTTMELGISGLGPNRGTRLGGDEPFRRTGGALRQEACRLGWHRFGRNPYPKLGEGKPFRNRITEYSSLPG